MPLTFADFARIDRDRCQSRHGFNHDLASWSLSDWITAVTGELGEAANVAKKLNRVRDGVPGNPMARVCPKCGTAWRHDSIRVGKCSCGEVLDAVTPVPDPRFAAELKAALADEIADTFIYLDLLAQSQGLRLDEIVVAKFNRTSEKVGYPQRIGLA